MSGRKNEYVIGRNSVSELLRHSSGRIKTLFITAENKVLPLAKEHGIPVQNRTMQQLTALVGTDSHQGCVAEVSQRVFAGLDELLETTKEESRSLLVLLDSIEDPGNFGSILRACECFGAAGVIFSKNRGVSITPSVTKASVGATELLPLIEVSNLAQALEKAKEAGFWSVVADVNSEAVSLKNFQFPEKTILVIGAEGRGVQPLILKRADFTVFIPLFGAIDSLNASQAAAIFLHSCRMQFEG